MHAHAAARAHKISMNRRRHPARLAPRRTLRVRCSHWQPRYRRLRPLDRWLCAPTFRWVCPFQRPLYITPRRPISKRRHLTTQLDMGMEDALHALVAIASLAPAALDAQDNEESTRAKQDVLWNRMEDSIRATVQQTDAVVRVAILDLTDQRSFYLNADAVYPTASTIKIAVLGELYRQHERATSGGSGAKFGDLYTLDAKDVVGGDGILMSMTAGVTRLTNRDLATLVVSLSDNTATNVLIDRGGMENVNASLTRLGLKETRLRRHMMDVKAAREGRDNTATPHELVMLLSALYEGRVFGKAMNDDFFT